MSTNGDTQFSAAILSRLQKQQDAMQGLFSAVESGLADLADPKRNTGVERLLGAIETGIADMVDALEGDASVKAIESLADAIAKLRLSVSVNPTPVQVNVPPQPAPVVNVEPTPITVECNMPPAPAPVVHIMPAPEQKGATWEIRIPGQFGAPDRVMVITRK